MRKGVVLPLPMVTSLKRTQYINKMCLGKKHFTC